MQDLQQGVPCAIADTMLLSAMYLAVGRSLHISPSQLGTLSMWRGLVTVRGCCRSCVSEGVPGTISGLPGVSDEQGLSCAQALCSPFAGIIGNIYNRLHLVAMGTVLWGTMALGMGFSTDYTEV